LYLFTCTSNERPVARKAPRTATRNASIAADGLRRRTAAGGAQAVGAVAVGAGSSAAVRRTARTGDRRRSVLSRRVWRPCTLISLPTSDGHQNRRRPRPRPSSS